MQKRHAANVKRLTNKNIESGYCKIRSVSLSPESAPSDTGTETSVKSEQSNESPREGNTMNENQIPNISPNAETEIEKSEEQRSIEIDDENGLSEIESAYDYDMQKKDGTTGKPITLNSETSEKKRPVTGIMKTIPMPKSQSPLENLAEVKSSSQSLVDESIGQLKELMRLSTAALWAQEAKARDPQMVNAAVNSAKAIKELLKLKIEAAKLR